MSSCLHCKMCEQKPYDSNCEVSSKVIRFAGSPGLWIPLCLFPPSAPMNVSPAVANLKLPSTPSPPFRNTLTSTYISSFNSCRCHKFCCSRKRSESKEDHATYLVSFKQFSLFDAWTWCVVIRKDLSMIVLHVMKTVTLPFAWIIFP